VNRWFLVVLLLVWIIAGVAFVGIYARRTMRPAAPLPVIGELTAFSLTDQNGKTVTLNDYRGNVWAAAFIFTRCGGSCPIIMNRLSHVQQQTAGEPVFITCFTVDPDYDTVDVLKRYARNAEADPVRWLFLTGDKQALHALALQQFKLTVGQSDSDVEPILHSSMITLIDRQGRIRRYVDAMGDDAATDVVAGLRNLLAEEPAG
jgi:protein SCO1/2